MSSPRLASVWNTTLVCAGWHQLRWATLSPAFVWLILDLVQRGIFLYKSEEVGLIEDMPRRVADVANGTSNSAPVEGDSMSQSVEHHLGFIGLCAVASIMKLANSIDDMVWLPPFVTKGPPKQRFKNCLTYVGIDVCLPLFAAAMAWAAGYLWTRLPMFPAFRGWEKHKALKGASAAVLFLYALHLLQEQRRASREGTQPCASAQISEEADSQNEPNAGTNVAELPPETLQTSAEAPLDATEEQDDGALGSNKLALTAIVGGLDDMCVQVLVLMLGVFNLWHVLFGVIMGCLLVLAMLKGVSVLRPIQWVMQMIPFWVVVALLAMYAIVSNTIQ